MKHGSNNRRPRVRGNNKRHNNHNHRNPQVDSNGPTGRVRGTAQQIMDKYLQQARDALSNGDRVVAENLFQHADHYYRLARQNDPRFDAKETAAYAAPAEDEDGEELLEDSEANPEEDASADEAPAPAPESVADTDSADEEKPRRRQPRPRRAPRKQAEEATGTGGLGDDSQGLPGFLARPVPIREGNPDEAPAAGADGDADAEEEKPKRRTRRAAPGTTTRTRRKKADDTAEQPEMPLGSADEAASV